MLRRISIARGMFAIGLAALNLGIVRTVREDSDLLSIVVGAIPTADLTLWTLGEGLISLKRGGRRPFLAGMTAFGAASLILYAAWLNWAPAQVSTYMEIAVALLTAGYEDTTPEWLVAAVVGAATAMPQILFALLGGWLMTELAYRPIEHSQGSA